MESTVIFVITILYSLILHVGNSSAIYRLGEEDPGRDGYYDEETPSDWVDILFILIIAIHHFEYAFKFTDYSLSHVHLKQHRLSHDDGEDEVANLDIDSMDQDDPVIIEKQLSGRKKSVAAEVINNIEEVFELFTTQSDTKTKRRPIYSRVCCCISWSPRFFTWQRTHLIRTFLKFYLCISCLLAMVLYVEFFMNLFVEYLITCIVHYEDMYVFALIMIPILLFVCDILIRLAWQAVIVSWSLNCDANGDLEAMDSQVGIAALRNRIVSSKRLLYTFTNDARDFDEYDEEKNENNKIKKQKRRQNSYKDFKIEEVDGHKRDGDDIELTTISDDDIKVDDDEDEKQSIKDKADGVLNQLENMLQIDDSDDELSPEQKTLKEAQEQKKLKEHRRNEAIKTANKEAHRAKMGDFFMATCWRMGFFIYSMIFACLGAWSVEVEVAVNGFFWQLVMRYCVFGGIIWTMVYSVCSLFVAVSSRYRSWYLIHSHIPRWKLFFLVDAHDTEVNNKNWTHMKMLIMFMNLFLFVLFIILSWAFIGQTWSSFIHFIGIIFALYYLINLFMACKPYALVALWTDSIPPPGKNYKAHQIASDTLKGKGLLSISLTSNKKLLKDIQGSPVPLKSSEPNTPNDDTPINIEIRKNTLADLKTKAYNKTIRTLRAEDLERRYAAFQYEYIECTPEDYQNAKVAVCLSGEYVTAKAKTFLYNYEQYWLNVYRPFDEYDIENNLSSTHILHGFQWMKGICQCKLCSNRGRRKTYGQKCYTIAKYFMDNFCNICVVVTVFLFMLGLFQTSQRLSGNNEAFRERVIYETNNTAYYGICSDTFGELGSSQQVGIGIDIDYDLSVLDVTVLTQLAYEADNYDLCQVINIYFNNTFEIVKIHREEPFYFHIRHKYTSADFIVIRGTDNVLEMMQDLSLFVEVAIFETLQWIVPFLNMLPTSFSRQIIYYASYIEGVINSDSRSQFDKPVFDYAKEYLHRLESSQCEYNSTKIINWHGPTTLYFVGHSLGGGISEIVAANLHEYITKMKLKSHIQSYGVCSPGVLLSSAKFGFGVEALDKTSSSLLPRRDIVSKVDEHGGSIQYTECDAGSMMQCHMMDNVLCELFYGCPKDLAMGPKKQWIVDFCDTSKNNNKTNKPQIGKSILKINKNSGITEISDWDIEEILGQCDNQVYKECNKVNQQFERQCTEFTADLCFSEQTLDLVQE